MAKQRLLTALFVVFFAGILVSTMAAGTPKKGGKRMRVPVCRNITASDECNNKAMCVWCTDGTANDTPGCIFIKEARQQAREKKYACTKALRRKLPLSNDASCAGKSESTCTGPCVWCVSRAVPSSCYTLEEAKRLPSAVFTCKFPTGGNV